MADRDYSDYDREQEYLASAGAAAQADIEAEMERERLEAMADWKPTDEEILTARLYGQEPYLGQRHSDFKAVGMLYARKLVERLLPAIERFAGAVRRFAGEEMSEQLAACLILKGADSSDVERFIVMCEECDKVVALIDQLRKEVVLSD